MGIIRLSNVRRWRARRKPREGHLNLPTSDLCLVPGFLPSSSPLNLKLSEALRLPPFTVTPSFPSDARFFSLIPFSFPFGNETRHSFVLFRSFRRNFAGSQVTSEESEQTIALEEIWVHKHIVLQSSCLCLALQCFARWC